jgi:hypothetical protein
MIRRLIIQFALVVAFGGNAMAAGSAYLAKSKEIRGGEAPVEISVDVTDVDVLELVATGYSWGQAVWAEPVLISKDATQTRLVDLTPVSVKVGWGTFSVNKGPDGGKLKVGGREFAHGLFAHADSRVVYRLGKKYTRFKSLVGINHTAEDRGKVVFEVQDGTGYELRMRCSKAKASFSRSVIAEVRGILESSSSSTRQLEQLTGYEKSFEQIQKGLQSCSAEELGKAEQFVAFAREIYLKKLDAPLLFVKRHEYWAGHIYDDYLCWHPGGGIYVIENPAAPIDEQVVRPVIDPATKQTLGEGVYREPDISYDARRVLFAFKGEKDGHTSIYEIGIDGKGLRRITNPGKDCSYLKPQEGLIGKGHHDISPCYLPSGRIAFTSTRTGGHVMCFSSYIDTLHTMNANGSDIKCISVNVQNEFDPAVLPDGRILYGRWEYVDKTALYLQSLWTVNPDGSNETALFANNMAKPTALLDARPVPGSRLIVTSLTPHNGQAVGAIAMIDPQVSKNSLNAMSNFTPEYTKEMDQGLRRGACDPWPVSEDVVLIANNDSKHGKHGVIELVTRGGFRTIVHRTPGITCYSPMLIKPRKKPPVKPSMITPGVPGRFMVHDIYQGMDGVRRGEVKWLRVIETTSRVSGIPRGGRWWNQAFLVSWQGSYDIKRFLGVVPVEEDGSAFFEAPVGMALYLQALDGQGRMIQSQRTFIQSVAGVTRSCIGCHIKEDNAAPRNMGRLDAALEKTPARLKAESWGMGFVDYPTMVQPVLDRHCVSCHGGDKGVEGGIDLTGGWTWAFNISYETLIKNTLTGFLNCHNSSVRTAELLDPRTHGSGVAPLTDLLLSGHKGRIKEMTRMEIDLIMAWMDGNCNYYGTWNYSPYPTCNVINSAGKSLVTEMKKAGCINCHQEAVGNDWINLRNPRRSRILRAPLASGGKGLGLEWCRDRKARRLDMGMVNQSQQPPDVFRPGKRPAPDPGGRLVTSFADTTHESYQVMLKIIQQTRENALKTPRVDMPGAEITSGKCRNLQAISDPYPGRIPVQ